MAASETHASNFMVSNVVIGEGGEWQQHGNHLQVNRGSYGVSGEQGACKDVVGRNGLQGRGVGACNSQKDKEGGVLPTLRGCEGSHARDMHAGPLPASAHVQVVESPRSGRAGEVQLYVGLLKEDNATIAAAATTAAALNDSAQSRPSLINTLLQDLVSKDGGTGAALQLSPSALSHMQSPHDAPPPSKLPPSPPLQLAADDKLKVLNLSPQDHSEGKSSFFQATLNCVSLLYGLGILSSPYAVAKAGWMGLIISVIVSTTYGYTAHLMAKCVEYDPEKCTNYQDIAKLTLGKRMRKVITALFYMELTGTLIGYCISMGDNLNYIFPHLGFSVPGLSNRNFMICVVSLIILPSVWLRDLSALSFTSIWCIASSVLLLVGVMLAATVNHIGFHHPPPFLRIKGVPVAAGLYAFSYGGTSVFPSICKSMKDPSKFTQVLILSFFIATASIGGLGVAGAFMFGDHTASQVTLSMPSHYITTKIVLWMTILTPIFKFALQLSPITTAVEKQLYKHCKNTHKASNKTLLFVLSTLMRSSVLALIVIISMILPYFEYIIALVGSSMTIAICMIFPCLFYLKLYWHHLPTYTITFIIILVVLGVIVGACGTIVAFGGLITSKTSHSTS